MAVQEMRAQNPQLWAQEGSYLIQDMNQDSWKIGAVGHPKEGLALGEKTFLRPGVQNTWLSIEELVGKARVSTLD